MLRKAFLAPWNPMVMHMWLYALAHAQKETGVAIHHSCLNINHEHTSVTPTEANLPKFTELVRKNMSKSLNTLLKHERYDAPGSIFDTRQGFQMRLLDAEAQASNIIYERVNSVAAGLVRRPEDMPDVKFSFDLWKGEPLMIDLPDLFYGKKRAKQLPLFFTVSPDVYVAFRGDIDRIVYHFKKLERGAVHELNRARTFPVLGAKRVRRIHPSNEPRTRKEPGGQLVPLHKSGARGVTGRVIRRAVCEDANEFQGKHADSNKLLLSGGSPVYPAGTYKMRVEHGVTVADDCNGILARRGMTLDEAKVHVTKAEAERLERGESSAADSSNPLIGEVQAAFAEEAADVLEADRMVFERPGDNPSAVTPSVHVVKGERPELEVQHRATSRRDSRAARLVTLRDYRRGRPKGNSDPPR